MRAQVYPVTIGPRSTGLGDDTALFVYRDGKLERRLTFDALFDSGRFSDFDCHFGPALVISSMDDQAGLVVVETVHEDGGWQKARVNFRTGEVVQRTSQPGEPNQPSRIELPAGDPPTNHHVLLWVSVAAAVVLGVAVAVLIRRRSRRAG